MTDIDGRIGALETDIGGKNGILARLEALEDAQNAIADDLDEVIWYLEENRGSTRHLSIVLAMLTRVVEKFSHAANPQPPQRLALAPMYQPEIFVPPTPDAVNRAARRRIARNGQEKQR